MSEWGRRTYGDPCACGFRWSISLEEAVSLVEASVDRYGALLADAVTSPWAPGLEWSAVAYVCHVADNLRIWAERTAGVALGAGNVVGGYDQDALGRARGYEQVSLPGALWSLSRAVPDWCAAVRLGTAHDVVLVHPERGEQTMLDVVRSNAHDAFHHGGDIERCVEANR